MMNCDHLLLNIGSSASEKSKNFTAQARAVWIICICLYMIWLFCIASKIDGKINENLCKIKYLWIARTPYFKYFCCCCWMFVKCLCQVTPEYLSKHPHECSTHQSHNCDQWTWSVHNHTRQRASDARASSHNDHRYDTSNYHMCHQAHQLHRKYKVKTVWKYQKIFLSCS